MGIAFIDLAAQQERIRPQLDAAIARVLDHGRYVFGPEIEELETKLAGFGGASHCLSCANGTDALLLALMAIDTKPGDAIFVPSFTFAATAEVVPCLGAIPVFVDCLADSFNMDPESLKRSIGWAKDEGLNLKAVMPVDLFGLPAAYDALLPLAHENGMLLIDDAAQGFGAQYQNRRIGSIGDITTTSFFPAKPLGCYGDGGAIFTENDDFAEMIASYRNHGAGSDKYDNERIGMNSRLDTMQAAVLLEKLAIYEEEIALRDQVATRYNEALSKAFQVPQVPTGLTSVWAQYTLRAKDAAERDATMARAKEHDVPSVIYYPIPLHQQQAYKAYPTDPKGLPTSEALADQVFSIPMHPYLDAQTQQQVIDAVKG